MLKQRYERRQQIQQQPYSAATLAVATAWAAGCSLQRAEATAFAVRRQLLDIRFSSNLLSADDYYVCVTFGIRAR